MHFCPIKELIVLLPRPIFVYTKFLDHNAPTRFNFHWSVEILWTCLWSESQILRFRLPKHGVFSNLSNVFLSLQQNTKTRMFIKAPGGSVLLADSNLEKNTHFK